MRKNLILAMFMMFLTIGTAFAQDRVYQLSSHILDIFLLSR